MTVSVLAVSFWCSASSRRWTWVPRPYVGAWVILLGVIGVAIWWTARGRTSDPILEAQRSASGHDLVDAKGRVGSGPAGGNNRTRTAALVCGVIGLWACLDWPLATLGAGYLASAQLVRQVLMVMVVAPLLLFACPSPLAVRAVGWGRRLTVLRWSARPIVAVPVAASALVIVNAPIIVDPLLTSPFGAFGLDFLWILAGFVLWMPVQCPHPGVRRLTGAGALTYLIGQSIVPVLPGFWMTWAEFPIYRTYEIAPRVFAGFNAVNDQQTAAAILQVGGMVLLWVQIGYRFLKWAYGEMETDRRNRKPIAPTVASNP